MNFIKNLSFNSSKRHNLLLNNTGLFLFKVLSLNPPDKFMTVALLKKVHSVMILNH